jgi:hypothetical protein
VKVCSCSCSQISSKLHFCTSEKAGDLNRLHIDNYKLGSTTTNSGRTAGSEGRPKGPKVETEAKPKSKAEERHVDSWAREGVEGRWTRVHRSARRALFTPFKVAGGPNAKTPLKRLRITRGKYLSSGRTFKVIDDWTVRANAHRVLEGTWLGTTDFREVAEYIDDDSDEEADEDPTKESEPAARESPSGGTAAEPRQEGETQYFELSPTKTDGAYSDELLITAPKTAAGKGSEDRSQLNCSESGSGKLRAPRRASALHLSATVHGHKAEGECTDGLLLLPPGDRPGGHMAEGHTDPRAPRTAAHRAEPYQGIGERVALAPLAP